MILSTKPAKQIIPIPALKDNYIWMLSDPTNKNVWIVDPGEARPVINVLKSQQLTLAGILITHHHADHTGGIAGLLHYAGDLPVVGSHLSSIKYINQPVKEQDDIVCGNFKFKALEIPGHTLDHIAYYDDAALFCGDTLFSAGCGKIFEGTPCMMYQSLSKLAQLNESTRIYCGHEYTLQNLAFAQTVEPHNQAIKEKIALVKNLRETNQCTLPAVLQEEKNINPFLRCHVSDVRQAVEERVGMGKKLEDPVEVLHALREWKNSF
ncbi:MAG TPA: hydroxyacylglutathione hydrolase [Gammaproteobacteria bacterium]|jgi:hydroxyacylglutathione hydrolase|nr:hydroxyacylglutathione hydrolase [Gammaproteobacteria bacterium]